MRSMIEHHRGAIAEAETCLANASHDSLLGLCSNIRQSQLTEIKQMQTWLGKWYGTAAPDGTVSPMPKGGVDTGVSKDSNPNDPAMLVSAGALVVAGAGAAYFIR